MWAIKRGLMLALCALLCATVSPAQDPQRNAAGRTGASQDVTIIIQQREVRFISQKAGGEMRLQVFDQSGEQVFDSGAVEATEVNWPLQATTGEALKSGLYAYTLSIKDVGTAEARLRRGHFIVDRAKDRDDADKLWVTSQNESGVGAELTVAKDEVASVAGATIGERTIGRRTEIADRDADGRAIGAEAQSQSKIDKVAGTEKGTSSVAAVAAGTAGQIAKFTTSTDVGNSVITELNGNIGIGLTNPTNRLHVFNSTSGTSAIYAVSETGPGVYGKSTSSRGVFGESDSFVGVFGSSGTGPGVIGASKSGYGVQGSSAGLNGLSGYFINTGGGSGVYSETTTGRAIWGKSVSSRGVFGESDSNVGVWGVSGSSTGVQGSSAGLNGLAGYFINTGGGSGVYSETTTGRALWGKSVSSRGVFGESNSNVGVWGATTGDGVGVEGTSASAKSVAGYFINTGGGKALKVDGIASVGVLEITNGSDFAENFDVSAEKRAGRSSASEIQPGMVVSIDPANPGKLNLTWRAYDRRVAGIISGAGGVKPGMTMGQEKTLADGKHPVALSGRVYVWADATRGAIRPGDLLTTSATPGHAMRAGISAKAQGAIIGKAMTGLKSGKGLILALVTLQ